MKNRKQEFDQAVEMHTFLVEDVKNDIRDIEEDIKNSIQRYPRKNEDILLSNFQELFNENFRLLCAKYSRGDSLPEIEQCYFETVNSLSHIKCNTIDYVTLLWLISLGIILEVPEEYMKMFAEIADQAFDDALINCLLNSCLDGHTGQTVTFYKPTPYSYLSEVVISSTEDKNTALSKLEYYVNHCWFVGHFDYGWRDIHKSAGYSGIWSFESAALAKLMHLDDNAIKCPKYYPYGLASYKNEKKYLYPTMGMGQKELNDHPTKTCSEHITEYEELNYLSPDYLHASINQLIHDFKTTSSSKFYSDYSAKEDIHEIWWSEDEFIHEPFVLQKLIIFFLVHHEVLLQVGYNEAVEDYLLNFVNRRLQDDYQDSPIIGDAFELPVIKELLYKKGYKLFQFSLDNDQIYIGILRANEDLDSICGIPIKNI